jgi:hypothetical protein
LASENWSVVLWSAVSPFTCQPTVAAVMTPMNLLDAEPVQSAVPLAAPLQVIVHGLSPAPPVPPAPLPLPPEALVAAPLPVAEPPGPLVDPPLPSPSASSLQAVPTPSSSTQNPIRPVGSTARH